jgi:hypothetical protein
LKFLERQLKLPRNSQLIIFLTSMNYVKMHQMSNIFQLEAKRVELQSQNSYKMAIKSLLIKFSEFNVMEFSKIKKQDGEIIL